MRIKHTADYAALRRAAYPPQADFADALYWDRNGQPAKLRAYYAACAAVKARFPKLPLAPEPVPQRVTRRQARRALLASGLLDQVESVIQAIADPVQRKAFEIDWNDATDFERGDPTLLALAGALGLTGHDLDALFVMAATVASD